MQRTSRGFTLMEMSVIVAVLLIMATAILPRLTTFVASQREHQFLDQLVALSATGREKAIALGKDVTLQYDDSATQFTLQYSDQNQSQQTLQALKVPTGLQPSKFQVGQNTTGASDFKLNFYPDGTSDGGGVELGQGPASVISLNVDKSTGASSLLHDSIPDQSQTVWQAGDYVHRSG